MKAEFTNEGVLCIIAETPTESYALSKWARVNVNENTPELEAKWGEVNYPEPGVKSFTIEYPDTEVKPDPLSERVNAILKEMEAADPKMSLELLNEASELLRKKHEQAEQFSTGKEFEATKPKETRKIGPFAVYKSDITLWSGCWAFDNGGNVLVIDRPINDPPLSLREIIVLVYGHESFVSKIARILITGKRYGLKIRNEPDKKEWCWVVSSSEVANLVDWISEKLKEIKAKD